jgi:hypothetical protein
MKKHFFCLIFIFTIFFSFGQVPIVEKNALISLYNSTNGPNWYNKTNWNTSAQVWYWNGVTVEFIDGQYHVTKLILIGNNLSGTLPSELGNLTYLKVIEFELNEFLTGVIPPEIGNLTNLETFYIDACNLSGTIPEELGNCSSLKNLGLELNHFTGNIPSSFSNLTSMISFWISDNNLSGNIPDFFANWPNLLYFSIGFNGSNVLPHHNSFTGILDLSNNSNLQLCWLYNNNLSTLRLNNNNNINIIPSNFDARLNPNLSCIFVDDVNWSMNNWSDKIDVSSQFVANQFDCESLNNTESNFEKKFHLYPNPVKDVLSLINNNSYSIKEIIITNSLGQKNIITNSFEINMSQLPKGLYFVTIEFEDFNEITTKILKE